MNDIQQLCNELSVTLHDNILSFWLNHMQDREHGGFYGRMTGEGQLVKDAPKGGILNARILWTFSSAYRASGRPEYLDVARRVKDYILQYFVDPEYGGTYWEVDSQGNPTDTHKQFYSQAFMIYGLAEYVRALREARLQHEADGALAVEADGALAVEADEVLSVAIGLYRLIEQYSHDRQRGGYIEACSRSWGEMEDMRLSELDENYPKSQNTHLHILEAYTNLLRVWPDEELRHNLHGLVRIFLDRILNRDTMRLGLFFDMDWHRRGAYCESYGHDIEFSWLIWEAVSVLGDDALLEELRHIVPTIARASEKGLCADGAMIHEANLDEGTQDTDRHWWVQAEAVVGYFNIYHLFGDEQSLHHAYRCWQYIRDHLIDRQLGEWYWSCDAQGQVNRRDDHAGFWKCPYHNSRMCMEVIRMLKGDLR